MDGARDHHVDSAPVHLQRDGIDHNDSAILTERLNVHRRAALAALELDIADALEPIRSRRAYLASLDFGSSELHNIGERG